VEITGVAALAAPTQDDAAAAAASWP